MRFRVSREYLGDVIGVIAFARGNVTGLTEEHDALIVHARFDSSEGVAALIDELADRGLVRHVEITGDQGR